jgi:hypothetical protein
MTRKELLQYLNSSFEIYSLADVLIDSIDGPGDIGKWLPGPDAPSAVAIFPVSYETFQEEFQERASFKATRKFLTEDLKEIPGHRDEMIILEFDPGDREGAKEIARKFGCNHFYWSAWDEESETRFLFLVEMINEVQIVYYFEPE